MKSVLIAGVLSALLVGASSCPGLLQLSAMGPAERVRPSHLHRGGLRFARQHREPEYRLCRSALFKVSCKQPAVE